MHRITTCSRYWEFNITMTDLVLHAVLHDQKNYHLFTVDLKL